MEKECKVCHQIKPLSEYYVDRKIGYTYSLCKECKKQRQRERYNKNKPFRDGVFYSHEKGRLLNHQGRCTSIYWSGDMLSIIRNYFPNTKNEEVAGMCGVSQSTLIRKARQLGLRKDKEFVHRVWRENVKLAILKSKIKPNRGAIKKGHIPWNKGLKNGIRQDDQGV